MIPIIRKIDDLGRIVIPKDIRKDLRIYKDDYLNMEVKDNTIIISKNKENNEYIKLCNKVINTLYKLIKNDIIITNNDLIIEYKGNKKYKIKNEKINENIINKIKNRIKLNEFGTLNITNSLIVNKYYIFVPIIINSNSVGSIIYLKDNEITKEEIKLIELSKLLLETYIEE